jgi:hypothetical protein
MRLNGKRESAQIIQFPLNRRFEMRQPEKVVEAIDPRVAAALDPAWYHMEAIAELAPADVPRH